MTSGQAGRVDYQARLERRLAVRPSGPLDVWSTLRHFALITYALPSARLAPYIPADRFEIPEFNVGGRRLALMSAVPFVDVDFHFIHLFPGLKFNFGQTNYRVYVIDKRTQEPCVWFFGTTLGSWVVHVARGLWGIPWHYARYQIACRYDQPAQRYAAYRFEVASPWGAARLELEDTGEPMTAADGFTSFEELQLILTHPVDGYYYRTDRRVGGYSVWHAPLLMTVGRPRHLYFGLYEALGLLSKAEMQRPHSVFLCPATDFQVYLPPRTFPASG
ncbi:MAG: DUF2071 domain-containing protein [Anaerolineales bacterium]|nr:DUF2071 domain-containing protein [Anaerolineales bacterium]